MKVKYRIPFVLGLTLIALLVVFGGAYAQLKVTNVFYTWDEKQTRQENSLATVATDGGWVPLFHQLNFDEDLVVDACAPGDTKWAGTMELGLYHVDTGVNPLTPNGFLESRDWQLVDCDLTGDGAFNNDDLTVRPTVTNTTPYGSATAFVVDPNRDVLTTCTTGNCDFEIVTQMTINLDENCDGVPDDPIPSAGVCFFAEAKKPLDASWTGNLQARIEAGGGDKTVNFKFEEPTAISLVSLTAEPSAVSWALPAAALALIAGIWIFLRRKVRLIS